MAEREHVLRVRVSDDELAAIDEAARVARRNRSDTVRMAFADGLRAGLNMGRSPELPEITVSVVDAPVFQGPVAEWCFTPSAQGAARLDELADREGCTRDEVARRVFKYGAWKMPPGYKG